MNKVVITGRVTRDPELRTTSSGTEVCNFAVAVDRRVKKGEEKKTDFVNCTAWSKTGVFVHTYFKKGDGIEVVGRIESEKYADKDGANRIDWHVTVEDVGFSYGKGKSGEYGQNTASASEEQLPF
jgi:single-strand DNA-binding protein